MTREEIFKTLRDTMQDSTQETIDPAAVTEQSEITSLGFDSLSLLDLIYDVQQAFELDFEAEQLTSVKTVGDLVSFLEEQLAKANP